MDDLVRNKAKQHLPWQLMGCGLLVLSLFLIVGGIWWGVARSQIVYPPAVAYQQGNCFTREWSRHQKTIRISRNLCYTTEESAGDVLFWYGTQGYEYRNQGRLYQSTNDLRIVHIATVERVYIIPQRAENTLFRVYQDTYIRLP